MRKATRSIGRVVVLVLALGALLGACSDDDDGGESSTSDAPLTNGTGATDDQLATANSVLEENIASEDMDPPVEVKSASVDEVVVGPVDEADTLEPDQADDLCSMVATVVFGYVPSAKVTIVNGDGTPVAATEVGGACEVVS